MIEEPSAGRTDLYPDRYLHIPSGDVVVHVPTDVLFLNEDLPDRYASCVDSCCYEVGGADFYDGHTLSDALAFVVMEVGASLRMCYGGSVICSIKCLMTLTEFVEHGDPSGRVLFLIPDQVTLDALLGDIVVELHLADSLECVSWSELEVFIFPVSHVGVFADSGAQCHGCLVKGSVKCRWPHVARPNRQTTQSFRGIVECTTDY